VPGQPPGDEDPTMLSPSAARFFSREAPAALALSLALFSSALFSSAQLAAQDELGKKERVRVAINWAKYEDSKSYVIEYESIIPRSTVKQVCDALDEVLTQYILVFRYKPTAKLKVKFLDSQNTYEQEGGKPSTAGFFSSGTEYLYLKQLPFYELIPTAYHEAFHQYLHHYLGKGAEPPVWFNEGMAMYFEGIQRSKETKKLDYKLIDNRKMRMVKDKVATRNALPLEKLFALTHEDFYDREDPRNTDFHYSQSFGVIYFFMQKLGGKPIYQFADTLKSTKELGPAYEKLLGKDRKNLKAVEANWKAYVAQLKLDEPKR
jgi:hypothetical protein